MQEELEIEEHYDTESYVFDEVEGLEQKASLTDQQDLVEPYDLDGNWIPQTVQPDQVAPTFEQEQVLDGEAAFLASVQDSRVHPLSRKKKKKLQKRVGKIQSEQAAVRQAVLLKVPCARPPRGRCMLKQFFSIVFGLTFLLVQGQSSVHIGKPVEMEDLPSKHAEAALQVSQSLQCEDPYCVSYVMPENQALGALLLTTVLAFVHGHARHLVVEGPRLSLRESIFSTSEWKGLLKKVEVFEIPLSQHRSLWTTSPGIANSVEMQKPEDPEELVVDEPWPTWLDESVYAGLLQQVTIDRSAAVVDWLETLPDSHVISASPHWGRQQEEAEAVLLNYNVPLAPQRTNIQTEAYRSVTLGGYTVRGVGITRPTQEHADVLQAIHQVAATRKGKMAEPYLAASISSSTASWHCDSNWGWSTLIALGSYSGGGLRIQLPNGQLQTYSVKKRWLRFDPRLYHAVIPATGQRVSVSLYVPRHPWKLRPYFEDLRWPWIPSR